uniref:Uncharacterized protein n=1 Tax=Ignisphaera aggregans TaxID=334771 RepID=A0A7J3I9J0_9CREN
MDWATTENRVGGRVRVLIMASGILCATVYLLHLLIAVSPLLYFEGFVAGYYSLLNYRLVYSHNSNSVAMPHTDYTRHISLTYAMVSLTMLTLSIVSIALVVGKRLLGPAGLIFGVASSLIPTYSLLYGFLYRVMDLDLGRFTHLNSNGRELVFRTNAGIIVYEGISINPTPIYTYILRNTALLTILTATAVALSATSIVLAMLRIPQAATAVQTKLALLHRPGDGTAYIALSTLTLLSLASIFTYYPASVAVNLQPPPATLEAPIYAYTCTGLSRTKGALVYTDFEAYPVPGWASSGGSWGLASGVVGAKGSVLRGIDNNAGVGASSYYYYNTSLSVYTTLWVAVKTRFVSRSENTQYYGIAMLNTDRTRVYAVVLENDRRGIEIRSFGVTATGWSTHVNRERLAWYSSGAWYTIVVRYSVSGTTINIEAYFYDSSGTLRLSASTTIAHDNVFVPAYIGVVADGLTAQYDEFIVSTADPRGISFSGFYAGMGLEVWNNLGELVYSGTVPGSITLSVVTDMVLGTGTDGRIVAGYPDNSICLDYKMPTVDAILGGDTYNLNTRPITVTLGANRTSASIAIYISGSSTFLTLTRLLRVSASQILYARLILDSLSVSTTLSLDIWLEGMTTSTSIMIRGGMPILTSTNVIQLDFGVNNFIAFSGYFTTAGQSATLYLRLELCTAPDGMGACVYYPIRLEVGSSA